MAKQTREQLGVKAGDKIVLKGVVSFARLDKAVTGDALEKENKRRAGLGMLPTKEFRSVTIEDPEVIQGQGTPLATYYGQSVYQSKSTGKQTMSFESKSLYPPQYGHIVNGVITEIADPMRNPAQGQVIYLMISAFAPKGFNNLGSTFDAIVFEQGDIKFYEGSNALAGFGQALNMPVETLPSGMAGAAPTAQPETQAQPDNGFGQANPNQNQGYGQPNQNGFGGAPVGDPNAPNQGQGFGAGQGTPNQGATSNPFGVQDADLAGGSTPFGGNAGNNGQRTSNPFA